MKEKKTIKLKWKKDKVDIKKFIRGGRESMGCGWCGHNNPEG